MRLLIAITGILLCACPLMAETYSWIDDNGTVNFADDLSLVPKKYRSKVKKLSDDVEATPPVPETAKTNAKAPAPPPSVVLPYDKTPVSDGGKYLYGGKKAAQWQQEFRIREIEYKNWEKKLDDLASQIKNPVGISMERHRALTQEFKEAQKEHLRALKSYNDLNDAANSARLPADFRK